MQFSGFWRRVGVALIDGIVLMIAGALAGGLLGILSVLSSGIAQGAEFVGQLAGIPRG